MTSRPAELGPGQESVWDYPRPPIVEDCVARLRVELGGMTIAETCKSKRVLETSHPPVYYFPPLDVDVDCLLETDYRTWCEWKGEARYYSVAAPGATIVRAAWYYPRPTPAFAEIEGYIAFYPGKMDACYVDQEKVQAQRGGFYGGWITSQIVGPFKG